jgi:hypothetical protein
MCFANMKKGKDFETFWPQDVSAQNYPRRFGPRHFGPLPNRPQNKYGLKTGILKFHSYNNHK